MKESKLRYELGKLQRVERYLKREYPEIFAELTKLETKYQKKRRKKLLDDRRTSNFMEIDKKSINKLHKELIELRDSKWKRDG